MTVVSWGNSKTTIIWKQGTYFFYTTHTLKTKKTSLPCAGQGCFFSHCSILDFFLIVRLVFANQLSTCLNVILQIPASHTFSSLVGYGFCWWSRSHLIRIFLFSVLMFFLTPVQPLLNLPVLCIISTKTVDKVYAKSVPQMREAGTSCRLLRYNMSWQSSSSLRKAGLPYCLVRIPAQ